MSNNNSANLNQILVKLGRLESLLDDPTPIMRGIAEILGDDVEDAFEYERDPTTHEKWAPLSELTKQLRRAAAKDGKMLQFSGTLASRVTTDYGDKFAAVGIATGAADDYAATMQFGDTRSGTKFGTITIPARKYIPLDGLHPDTVDRVSTFLDTEITKALS